VELSSEFVYSGEVENRLPAIYSFPAYRDDSYRAATRKRVVPGCSPWLYMRKPQEEDRVKVLLMPAHSSVGINAEMDDGRFAELALKRYQGEDLQCSIYWRDLQLGRHIPYLQRDIPVVSAGHMFDPLYFERLAGLFATAKVVLTNEFGSHVFYAASHDVPVVVMADVGVEWVAPDELLSRYCATGPVARIFEDLAPLFQQECPDILRQRPAAQLMLGAERMMSEMLLRDLLEELWRTPGFRSRVVPRWQMRRRIAPARSFLRKLIGRK
jgi:hypothetical protein